jgi:hypothetical protein
VGIPCHFPSCFFAVIWSWYLLHESFGIDRGGIDKNLRKIICPKIKFEVWKL